MPSKTNSISCAKILILSAIVTGSFFTPVVITAEGTARQVFDEARECQEKGNFRLAERAYVHFLQLEPNSAVGHANLGVVYAHQEKISAAIREYEKALQIDPGLHSIYLNLGIAHFRKKDYKGALHPLTEYLAFEAGNSQARQLLGLSYVELNQFQKAVDVLAPMRNANDPQVLLALGACYVHMHQMSRAREVITDLLLSHPNSPQINYLLGEAYVGLNDYPHAEKEFQRVYAMDSNWPQIAFLLGAVMARNGEFKNAQHYLHLELQRDPESFAANLTLGALLNELHRYAEAIPVLKTASHAQPDDSQNLYELAHAYWETGRKDQAWTTAQQAIGANARNRQAHYLLGQMARANGNKILAKQEFLTAASLSEAKSNRDILRLAERSHTGHQPSHP
jgi:tetratricopeptide (TPR) repeat protein